MIHKILRRFPNTFTVNEKRDLLTIDNLTQTIQIDLSQEEKTFFQFFLAFFKSILNFKHLLKKHDPRCRWIAGNTGSEKNG